MKINHYTMDTGSIDYSLFDSLFRNNLFSNGGILKDVYERPEWHINGRTFVSTVTRWKKPISVMFLSQREYGGWEKFNEFVTDTFGIIGFFTEPEFRGRGLARTMFEEFDKTNKIRKLSCSPRCHGILKSVEPKDIVTIPNA